MKKNLPSTEKKPLRLNKTSVAHLTLTDRQMGLLQGGAYNDTDTLLSEGINNPNPCTTLPIPTVCSRGIGTN